MKKENKEIIPKIISALAVVSNFSTITEVTLPKTIDFIEQTYQKIAEEFKNTSSKEEIKQSVTDITSELNYLNDQLTKLAKSPEYLIKNGEGKEINLATDLDYHQLISKMEEISEYYYFSDIPYFMEEAGYNKNEDLNLYQIQSLFFSMPYKNQADILSRMFIRSGTYTYKVATEYSYTADIKEYDDGHKECSNIKAHATKIEERGIPIYTCRASMSTILGLFPKNIQN